MLKAQVLSVFNENFGVYGVRMDFVLDDLEQVLHQRQPLAGRGFVRHSHRASQYVSIRSGGRSAEAGIAPSVGRVGEFYDNAQAEMGLGLFKTKVFHSRGSCRLLEAVEFATLEWVDWFNNRLLKLISHIPRAEVEEADYSNPSPCRSPRRTRTDQPPGNTVRFAYRSEDPFGSVGNVCCQKRPSSQWFRVERLPLASGKRHTMFGALHP